MDAAEMLDHNSPVPLHEQLTIVLRAKIESGELTGRVPSIISLAQQYQTGHNTAARALATLRDEGLITSARGRGYYVTWNRARDS